MSSRRRHLLVVTPHAPWPVNHGFAIRLRNHLERIHDRHDVSLFCFIGGTDDAALRDVISTYCRRLYLQKRGESVPPGGAPRIAHPYLERGIRDRLDAIIGANDFDLVQIESTDLSGLIDPAWNIPTVVVAHDIATETEFRRWRSQAEHGFGDEARRTLADLRRVWKYERRGLGAATQIHCMSSKNRRRLALLSPALLAKARVVPNGVDTRRFTPDPRVEREGVLFVGSFSHPPNLDAFDVLIQRIWPEVLRRRPDSRLTVAGASPPQRVLALDGRPGVRVLGEVPDTLRLFQSHVALAVPLRAGSGTRIKILEALSCGLPVVSTRIGAEGIEPKSTPGILVANHPAEFARRLVRLLDEPDEAARAGLAGRDAIVARYDWSASVAAAMSSYEEIFAGSPRSARVEVTDRDRANAATPLVEVLIPVRKGATVPKGPLEAARAQATIHEVRWTLVGEEEALRALECGEVGRAIVEPCGSGEGAVAAGLNRAIATSAAKFVALLDPGDTPASEHWLDNLVWCLLQPNAPAAVQGERMDPEGVPTAREKVAARGAWPFRFSNSALSVELARDIPFPVVADAAARWEGMIETRGLFVLSTPDAPVVRSPQIRGS